MISIKNEKFTRTLLIIVSMCIATILLITAHLFADSTEDQAAREAFQQAVKSLKQNKIENIKRITIVPLLGDPGGKYTDILKIEATKSPYELILRDDEEWNNILNKLEWEKRREDIMDPDTAHKLGDLLGVDAILFGSFRTEDNHLTNVSLTFNLKLADTVGRMSWGEMVTGTANRSISEIFFAAFFFIKDNAYTYRYYILGVVALLILLSLWKRAMRPR